MDENPENTGGPAVMSRALHYVLALPPSLEGQRGHAAAFRVAAALCQGFALDRAAALDIMRQWSARRASPQWGERELAHKIDSALSTPGGKPRGYLLRQRRDTPGRADSASPEGVGVAPPPALPRTERLPAFHQGMPSGHSPHSASGTSRRTGWRTVPRWHYPRRRSRLLTAARRAGFFSPLSTAPVSGS